MSLTKLKKRIAELGEGAVVSLELFFDGNQDPASIGCNLSPHPGVPTFARVLRELRARPEVADIVVQITEVMPDDEWPFVDTVYVITTADDEDVHAWAAALQPDPPTHDRYTGWRGDPPPPGAPDVPEGHRVTYLWWD